MSSEASAEATVQRQLDAYNAHDMSALLATYAVDAEQFEHPAKLVARGHAQIRERMAIRFQEMNLHARLTKRAVMGDVVIDHEEITRTFPEGVGTIELVAIYQVRDGKIQTGSFIFGEKRLGVATKR
jgi:hypothetical protein